MNGLIASTDMKKFFFPLLIALLPTTGHAKLNVVATIPDFGAIAQEIGGDKIKVTSIARGTEDAHFVDARPSFIRVLNQADVLIEGGAELEIGWLPPLLQGARNSKIQPGTPGLLLQSTASARLLAGLSPEGSVIGSGRSRS